MVILVPISETRYLEHYKSHVTSRNYTLNDRYSFDQIEYRQSQLGRYLLGLHYIALHFVQSAMRIKLRFSEKATKN